MIFLFQKIQIIFYPSIATSGDSRHVLRCFVHRKWSKFCKLWGEEKISFLDIWKLICLSGELIFLSSLAYKKTRNSYSNENWAKGGCIWKERKWSWAISQDMSLLIVLQKFTNHWKVMFQIQLLGHLLWTIFSGKKAVFRSVSKGNIPCKVIEINRTAHILKSY